MMLREIAESDYHYDASVVAKWTLYQLRMYVSEKKLLSSKRQFVTREAAYAYAAEQREKMKPKLKTFALRKD